MPSPLPHVNANAVDLERHVADINSKLTMNWLERKYGLAVPERKALDDTVEIIYPRVYGGGREHTEIQTDDELQGKSFFYVPNEVLYDDNTNTIECTIRLIVMINVNKIQAASNSEYSPHPYIGEIIRLNLNGTGGLTAGQNSRDMTVLRYYYSRLEDVFEGFNFWLQDTNYRTHPLNCFRIDFNLKAQGDCT